MATHSSTLAWRIPGTVEPGGMQSIGLQSQTWLTMHVCVIYSIRNIVSSVQFCCSVVSDFLWLHGLQHVRLCCPSPTPGVYSNSCPLSQWCHPTISSSVALFSSCPQSFLESGSFQWVDSYHQVARVFNGVLTVCQDWKTSNSQQEVYYWMAGLSIHRSWLVIYALTFFYLSIAL